MTRLVTLALALVSLHAATAAADAIYSLSAFNCSRQGVHNDFGGPDPADCETASQTGALTANLSATTSASQGTKRYPEATDLPNTFYGRADASVVDGALRVFNEVEVQNYDYGTYTAGLSGNYDRRRTAAGFAGVTVVDTYLVQGPAGGAGGDFYFRPIYGLTGTMYDNSLQMIPTINICDGIPPFCVPTGIAQDGPRDIFDFYDRQIQSPLLDINKDKIYRATFGQPFEFKIELYSWIFMNDAAVGGAGATYDGLATVDFLHTLEIVGFGITDAAGAPISDVRVFSGSGIGPSERLPAAPEPATAALVALGLGAGWLRRRRAASRLG